MNGKNPMTTPVISWMTPVSPKYPNKSISQLSPIICKIGTAFSVRTCDNDSGDSIAWVVDWFAFK